MQSEYDMHVEKQQVHLGKYRREIYLRYWIRRWQLHCLGNTKIGSTDLSLPLPITVLYSMHTNTQIAQISW